jgi:hypothetical protein
VVHFHTNQKSRGLREPFARRSNIPNITSSRMLRSNSKNISSPQSPRDTKPVRRPELQHIKESSAHSVQQSGISKPDHLDFDFEDAPYIFRLLIKWNFMMWCILATGYHDPYQLWDICHSDHQVWKEFRQGFQDRMSTITVVVSAAMSLFFFRAFCKGRRVEQRYY